MAEDEELHTDDPGDAKTVPVPSEHAAMGTSEAFPVAQGIHTPDGTPGAEANEQGADQMQQGLSGTKPNDDEEKAD